MPINLQEIRTAVQQYLDTKVTVTVSTLTPATGASIGPSEQFSFNVTAVNANAANGGIYLKNVRWRLSVDNSSVGKLIVPPAPMVARTGPYSTSSLLTAGTEVSEMYLFPPDANANHLHVGDTDTISGLRGKAGSAPSGGTTNIRLKILAEVDMDYLFPKNEDTPSHSRALTVVG